VASPPAADRLADALFAKAAVERKYVTLGALRECLDVLRDRERSRREPLSGVMVRQGVLTRADVDAIELVARSGAVKLQRIDRYEIVAKIGEGGMGAVYAAIDTETLQLCALKVLPDDLAKDRDLVKRFLREAETACELRHPNMVGGLRVGEDGGVHFFAMEFVDGETLYDRLEREGTIPEKEALRIARGICLALQYASEKGLVHRDIKPENIMLDRSGTPRLLDMGLVKRLDASRATRLTQSGMAIGTPHYISPEQARGEENVDTRSDIYALGATMYHALTGNVPFEGATAAVIMTKHLSEELDWPSDVNPEISENTSRLISKMMAKERKDRYSTPKDVVADIDLILSGKAPSGELLPPGASSIRRAVMLARAIDRAAEREKARARARTTAVAERIEKRKRESGFSFLKRRKQTFAYAALAGAVLAMVAFVAALSGPSEPEPPPSPSPIEVPAPHARLVEELRVAPVERIPELVDSLPAPDSLYPAAAHELEEAREAAMRRFDAEAERRLERVLAATVEDAVSRARALEELRVLRATFARSRHRSRIEAAISALERESVPPEEPAAREAPPAPRLAAVELSRLELWRSYGNWRAEGDALAFVYDPKKPYSKAIVSELGFGECELAAEITTDGGSSAEFALWDQAAADAVSGTSGPDAESCAVAVAELDDLRPATGRWARLSMKACAEGIVASLDGRPLRVRRQGTLSHGRVRFSLHGGVWRLRDIRVTPLLAEGRPAYAVALGRGNSHRWSGRQLDDSVAAVRRGQSGHSWLDLPGGGDVFEISAGMRLAIAFIARGASSLEARLVARGGDVYSFRLSGRPSEGLWTALSVPLDDFRSSDGHPPRPGTAIRGMSLGAEGPDDLELAVSLVRVVR